MKPYLDLLQHIVTNGQYRSDRTGVGTYSVFGTQTRYDLTQGFPAVTTKKLAWRACVSELLWFLEGSTDERRLSEILHGTRDESKRTIWTDNAQNQGVALGYSNGELGPVYGKQWRDFGGVDQVNELVNGLKSDPYSRRHIISAWNPAELSKMSLPPCHVMTQYYVGNDGRLSCQLYQRSADTLLGVPFNVASYSLFTHMLAQVCGLQVGEFIHTIGDAHIYANHLEQVNTQLKREPLTLPTLWLNPEVRSIFDFTMDDIKLVDYQCHPPLPAPMAV